MDSNPPLQDDKGMFYHSAAATYSILYGFYYTFSTIFSLSVQAEANGPKPQMLSVVFYHSADATDLII
jgi:hypothetical protein